MVGLSVVLEAQNGGVSKKTTQVINKTAMLLINKSSSPSDLSSSSCKNLHSLIPPGPTFLDQCFLCYEKLLPGKDIYMYKGDRAFCSVECRCRQIFMDEEESLSKNHCSLAAMKPTSSSSSSSSSTARRQRKGAKNRAGGFAY
ncbi:FCS-Like Zinc finger 15-like isoform X1 [Juglans microcarpa x Juglans regia]|uniref:FCS-Like Zinc finger 15-like isoform X1 n=1 Tax=Juglans microcarpa x Juglans regia TaxID=2249226 RepID=UPI001B7E45CF|nr:FCS-Like Zinc finger 15-like isoform X1 [Juglans microcarpa x Juglans regia]